MNKIILICSILFTIGFGIYGYFNWNLNPSYSVGQPIDQLNGVVVYYNGNTSNVVERNTVNGYNLGLKYQCVEFVKRYYYEVYKHKMPNSFGHAIDFFIPTLKDGKLNAQRNLYQFSNPSISKPEIGDIIVFNKTLGNKYGHVCIIANVEKDFIEIIQQNGGPFTKTRKRYTLKKSNKLFYIENNRILGWLRK